MVEAKIMVCTKLEDDGWNPCCLRKSGNEVLLFSIDQVCLNNDTTVIGKLLPKGDKKDSELNSVE